MKKYIIYADEAWTHDFPKRYHNFFGGFLAEETVFLLLEKEIRNILKSYNYRWEIKWSKISIRNKDLYHAILSCIFLFLESNPIVYRQMFRDKRDVYLGDESSIEGQFKLFYQFIKYSFGLEFVENNSSIQIIIDEHSSVSHKLKMQQFCKELPIYLNRIDLTIEIKFVNSRASRSLQCCDLLMGSAGYYGNKMYKDRQAGQSRISKIQKTRKELSKFVYDELRRIDAIFRGSKAFNWFETTSTHGNKSNRFCYKIAIWKFVPNNSVKDKRWENDGLSKNGETIK